MICKIHLSLLIQITLPSPPTNEERDQGATKLLPKNNEVQTTTHNSIHEPQFHKHKNLQEEDNIPIKRELANQTISLYHTNMCQTV